MEKLAGKNALFFMAILWILATPVWAEGPMSGMMDSMMPNMKEGGILLDPTPQLGQMEIFDEDMQMVMPFARPHMSSTMLMLHGYGFFEALAEEGVQRGRADFSAPNMFMADLGTTLDDHQYLNLDVMLTSDLWTVPSTGTPQLLQIGEDQTNGQPFIDAQHPHSSPLMGLTLSDTISLADDKSALKLFAAPRGESTDGPIAFMHRITGMVNPSVPLGHHIGQDVGHITSTLLGESLKLGSFHIEASIFNGSEPNPTQVDLPLGPINSYAVRAMDELASNVLFMASYANVGTPEPGIANDERFSASLYTHTALDDTWTFHNTLIYGGITNIDNATFLNSILDEFLFNTKVFHLYGRVEELQRTPGQLAISSATPNVGEWVTAITVGFSHQIVAWDGWELIAGLQATNDQVPSDFQAAYEGNPFSYQFFFQLGGTQAYSL